MHFGLKIAINFVFEYEQIPEDKLPLAPSDFSQLRHFWDFKIFVLLTGNSVYCLGQHSSLFNLQQTSRCFENCTDLIVWVFILHGTCVYMLMNAHTYKVWKLYFPVNSCPPLFHQHGWWTVTQLHARWCKWSMKGLREFTVIFSQVLYQSLLQFMLQCSAEHRAW